MKTQKPCHTDHKGPGRVNLYFDPDRLQVATGSIRRWKDAMSKAAGLDVLLWMLIALAPTLLSPRDGSAVESSGELTLQIGSHKAQAPGESGAADLIEKLEKEFGDRITADKMDGCKKALTEVKRTFHDKKGELKKYQTETKEDYKKRKDLARGRAEARFGRLSTQVQGGATWVVEIPGQCR